MQLDEYSAITPRHACLPNDVISKWRLEAGIITRCEEILRCHFSAYSGGDV